MAITTDEIIAKFNEVYPGVEGSISAASALYKQGLGDLERLYNDHDITGNDKAKFIAGYVTNSTMAMINGAMQVSLGLLQQAYTLPMQQQTMDAEIEYKEAQTTVLRNSETLNALIKTFQALSDMMGAMGSGGITATPAMLAANRMSIFKLVEILKNPNNPAEFLFTRGGSTEDPEKMTDIAYLNYLVDKSKDKVVRTPDVMRRNDNNMNY